MRSVVVGRVRRWRGSGFGVSHKVSAQGGLSVYGLGRFPVTLYPEQWTKLLDMTDDIRAFIRINEAGYGC